MTDQQGVAVHNALNGSPVMPHSAPASRLLLLALAQLPFYPFAPCRAGLEVILLRHADKDVIRRDFNLSPVGFSRAIGLARLIPACLGRPTSIFTYAFDPDSSKNARSYQSAVPLAVATGTTIRIALESQDHSFQFGEQLRQRAPGPSERLVLFWEHRRMPELARGLGWDGMAPIAEDDFDQLFLFRYAHPGSSPQVSVLRQSQLGRLPCFLRSRFPLADRWTAPFPAAAQ